MSEYVPTTGEVETGFSEFAMELNRKSSLEYPKATPTTDFTAAFYRWLAAHDAQVRADALESAALEAQQEFVDEQNGIGYARVRTGWLRTRAAAIRAQLTGPTS